MSPIHGSSAVYPPRPYALRLLAAPPAVLGERVLACIEHGRAEPGDRDPRRIVVDLPLLSGAAVEVWESLTPVTRGERDGIAYAENGTVLFGQLRIDEAALVADTDGASAAAYAQIENFLLAAGYPATLRIWNYIAGITRGTGDDERYRQFVLGRYRVLAQRGGFERELPAATAIGTAGEGLTIYFLAGRVPGAQVENPRQTSAFRYPREYGPRSPSFSRANLLRWRDGRDLFVSGTASIVGHQSLHVGNPAAQLDETLANIAALLREADASARWRPQLVKLYLRDPAQRAALQPRFAAAFADTEAQIVLGGEICREGLDLEIEALFRAE